MIKDNVKNVLKIVYIVIKKNVKIVNKVCIMINNKINV